jgi:hypothetical protein
MTRRFLLLALSLFLVSAKAADPRPGKYILDKDTGTLDIRRDARGVLVFEIQTIGANCHTCEVSGVIRNGVGSAGSLPEERCDIAFKGDGGGLELVPITDDTCRAYCGARASFEGTYRIPPPSCTVSSRQTRNKEFLVLYRAHRYIEAAAMLEAHASQCKEFMSWIEIDQLRNDLALAHYHSGAYAQCIATLNTTTAGGFKDETELKNTLPPCDFDNYSEIAKSTWFNKKMCLKAMKRKH